MPFETLTPVLACEALARVGLQVAPADVRVEARDGLWVVHLPGARLAWFASSERGRQRLETERRVLRVLQARCSTLAVPRLLFQDASGSLDVRSMVRGDADPWEVYARVREDGALAVRLGRAIGGMLAEQHLRVRAEDVAGWLSRRPGWPESAEWIRERLPRVINDAHLIAQAAEVMARYGAVTIAEAECAFVHTDVGFHNMGIDLTSQTVHGLFDYEEAAWADRHHDFRYLVFDLDRYELLNAALEVYEPVVGRSIDRGRVLLYNAACAITFLAYRAGTTPEQRSCGRTLIEDLRWSRHAIAAVLASKTIGV